MDLEEDEASSLAKSNLEEEVARDSDEEEELEEAALPRFAPPTVSFTGFNAQGYIAWPRLGEKKKALCNVRRLCTEELQHRKTS